MNITVLQFHSKAKKLPKSYPNVSPKDTLPEDATYRLSNFSPDSVEYEGHVYPTAEHAYQAQKYKYSSALNPNKNSINPEELMTQFYDGTITDPIEAKRKGSKAGMKKTKYVLNIQKWARDQDAIMDAIIKSKIERSPHIRNIIRISAKQGIRYVHFSRTDMYWGAHFDKDAFEVTDGLNKLGEIYNRHIYQTAI